MTDEFDALQIKMGKPLHPWQVDIINQSNSARLRQVRHDNNEAYRRDPYTRNLVDILVNIAADSPEWELLKNSEFEDERRDFFTLILLRLPIFKALVLDIKQDPQRSTLGELRLLLDIE